MKNITNFFNKIQNNEIISESFNLFEIFQENKIFKIKSFQRKYAWDIKQVNELINDVDNYDINKNFFLGTIIIKKTKNKGTIEYSIVDGQQRITTLFLILKSIELTIKQNFKLSDFEEFDLIRNLYLLRNGNEEKLKIEGYRNNTKELETILTSDQIQEINEIDASYKMKNYINIMKSILGNTILNSSEKVKTFISKIKNISFSVILLGEDIDENKVFEDLNSKGSPLLIEDLLRNYFYTKSRDLTKKENSHLSLENIEHKANEIMNNYEASLKKLEEFLIDEKNKYRSLFSNKINRFFKNFILYKINNMSKLNEDNDRRMFLRYKNESKNKIIHSSDIREELNNIDNYFKFCNYMTDYNVDLEKIQSKINNEKYLLNSLDFYPFIFSFYSKWEEKYRNSIIIFSTIIYINLLVRNINIWKFLQEKLNLIKTATLDSGEDKWNIMNNLIPKLLYPKQNSTDSLNIDKKFDFWEEMKKDIQNKITDNSDIYNSIEFKRFIQYFLLMQDINASKIKLVDKKYDLEHIISKNLSLENNLEQLHLFSKINKLENLCLIEKDINKRFGNENFNKKINIYKEEFIDNGTTSSIKMVNEIFDEKNLNNLETILETQRFRNNDFSKKFIEKLKEKWNNSMK